MAETINGYVITVYGERKSIMGNEYYYSVPIEIMHDIADESQMPIMFKLRILEDRENVLYDVVLLADDNEVAQDVARKIRESNLYERIEILPQEIDLNRLFN